MTIETQTSKAQYLGDGTARLFPVPFTVYKTAHLQVILSGDQNDGVTLSGGYRAAGLESGMPTVELDVPPQRGERLTIARILPLTQALDLENGGKFDADSIEQGLDVLEMQIQQISEAVDRAVKVAITSDKSPEQLLDDLLGSADRACGCADEACRCAAEACECAEEASEHADRAKQQADKVTLPLPDMPDDAGKFISVAADGAWELSGVDLPVATAAKLGGVKVGSGLSVTEDGTLSAGEGYALPAATTTKLGGVKVGANLSVTADGTLSAGAYTLPTATSSRLGGVKAGWGISVSGDGTIYLAGGNPPPLPAWSGLGQWGLANIMEVNGNGMDVHRRVQAPSGGTWAYLLCRVTKANGSTQAGFLSAGLAAGDTVLYQSTYQAGYSNQDDAQALCWRIY